MDESGDTPIDHFNKQRRNIVIISLILLFYHMGNLSFTEFNVLGNRVLIGNPEIVRVSLYVFFLYFLWRFFTACNAVYGMQEFRKAYEVRVEQAAYRRVLKEVARKTKLLKGNYALTKLQQYDPDNKLIFNHKYQITWLNPTITDAQRQEANKSKNIEVKGGELMMLTLQCLIKSMFYDRPFGEYVLPYLLAFFTLCELLNIGLVSLMIKVMQII